MLAGSCFAGGLCMDGVDETVASPPPNGPLVHGVGGGLVRNVEGPIVLAKTISPSHNEMV